MNVRGFLVIGVKNDLVDELDQFVVVCGRFKGRIVRRLRVESGIHVGQHLFDGAAVSAKLEQLANGFFKLGLGGVVANNWGGEETPAAPCGCRARLQGPGT